MNDRRIKEDCPFCGCLAKEIQLKELSKGYLAFFAARACAQPVDFILGLDGKSFAKITRKAQNFLLTEG